MLVPISARQTLLETLPKGGIGAEVGVFRGDFSAELLQATRAERLHLIDPWVSLDDEAHKAAWYGAANRSQADMDQIHAAVTKRFAKHITAERVVVHRAPSTTALAALPDHSLDWIYIDGDHSYDGVIADLRLSLTKVKPGGFICGDDYLAGGWWKDGVICAVHEFLHEARPHVRIRFLIDAQFMLSVVK
jgi:hypothetical protein